MNRFLSALSKLKMKMTAERFMLYMGYGLCGGLMVGLMIMILSKFYYIKNLWIIFAAVTGVFMLIGIGVFFAKMPKMLEVAKEGDKLGFKERFVTAYEILKKNEISGIENMAVVDALKMAESADLAKLYKIRINRTLIYTFLILLMSNAAVFAAPSPNAEEIEKQKEIREIIEEKEKEIEKAEEKLAEKGFENKEIKEEFDKLKKELKDAKSEGEAIKAIQKTQKELKRIEKENVNENLTKLGEKLEKYEQTKDLANALKNGNSQQIKQRMNDLSNSVKNMNDEQRKQLAQNFKDIAEEMKDNPEIADALNDVGKELEKDLSQSDMKELNDSLDVMGQTLEELANENADLRKALDELDDQLSKSSVQKGKESIQGKNGQKQNGENGQQGQQGNGQDPNGQQGQNGQNGQQGNGQDPNGQQGQNGQQGNGQQGQNGQNGQGEGSGKGAGSREMIYSRNAENKQHYDAEISGELGEGGNIEKKEEIRMGEIGGTIEYEKVYNEYKNDELSSLDESDIPVGMKNIVKDYFSELE